MKAVAAVRGLGVAIAVLMYIVGSFAVLGLAIDIINADELVSLANALKLGLIVVTMAGLTALKRKAGSFVP